MLRKAKYYQMHAAGEHTKIKNSWWQWHIPNGLALGMMVDQGTLGFWPMPNRKRRAWQRSIRGVNGLSTNDHNQQMDLYLFGCKIFDILLCWGTQLVCDLNDLINDYKQQRHAFNNTPNAK
jgi:hypothetical protein